ncbi:MAG TPA: PEP/pyruvate-binding domain-containing protein [Candidatus Limnocylindrales bacterium]|nr:PEP/pyruvate-binding domain-containing protein [Candidatus Limnocylindrales bacterium]
MSPFDGELIAWLGLAADRNDAPMPDVANLGGKGASLARLAHLGFRVPPAFCLTTSAFRAQLAEVADTAGLGATAADGAALATAPLAEPLSVALTAAVTRLVGELAPAGFAPRFAVRSSAIAEDGAASSYAGLHETELDVPPAGIDAAVRRCWASLWSPEATAYRRRRSLDPGEAAMAVVVQALVPADASAVVFTRHPVTGRADQVVITSTRGLGDAMVAGTITPDTTVVDKASRRVLELDPGDGSSGAAGPALGPDVLAELVELSLQVEDRFGLPVDIEAAHAGGTWYLLQARPITTGASFDAAVGAP